MQTSELSLLTIFFFSGLFDEELGEDFFGFKELGLDTEMKSLRVPSKLWFGKEPPVIQPISVKVPNHTPLKYPFPPPFLPASTNAMIGLLQPWYQHHLQDNKQDLPKKPRYPPVNIKSAYSQHHTTKKRILKENNTNIDSQDKRNNKRKKISEQQEKAQKKQQKLELKAQKLAEKEQKKKQREEEKLAKKKNS
jgi:transcriptional activator SPT7